MTFWTVIGLLMAFLNVTYNCDFIKKQGILKIPEDYYPQNKNIIIHPFRPDLFKLGVFRKIIIAIMLIFFAAFLLKSSITTLSIAAKQDRNSWENEYGFYNVESFEGTKVRWVSTDASTVMEKGGSILSLSLQDGIPVKRDKALIVKVYIDNYLTGSIKLNDDSWYNLDLKIPAFTGDRITVTLVSSSGWIPKELGINNDTRELAFRLGEFKFK